MQGLTLDPPALVDANLVALAAYGLAGSRRALPIAPLEQSVWSGFIDGVARERLAGMLGAAIRDGAFPATDEQREQAATLQTEVAAVALLIERLLLLSADHLARADLEFRVLKGPAVAHLDYAEPALRSFGDLDLLVRADDFRDAVRVLESAGGRRTIPELRRGFDERFGKGAVIAMPGDLEVDLHRSFVAGPLGMTIDLDGLFMTSAPFTIGDRKLAGLGNEERFLHSCIHAGLGRPTSLHSLRDVAQAVLKTDVELDLHRVHGLATSWRATAVAARAIDLAWTTLDLADSVPLSAWAAKYRPGPAEYRLLDAYVGGDRSFTRQAVATVRVIPRRRDKVAFARSVLFPERRYLEARGGSRLQHVRRGTAHLSWGIPR